MPQSSFVCTRLHRGALVGSLSIPCQVKTTRQTCYRHTLKTSVNVLTNMASDNSLRLGVIGTGHMAARYAQSWVAMPEVAYVAVSDVNAASRRKFIDICRNAGRPEPREFDDFGSMLTACRDELD